MWKYEDTEKQWDGWGGYCVSGSGGVHSKWRLWPAGSGKEGMGGRGWEAGRREEGPAVSRGRAVAICCGPAGGVHQGVRSTESGYARINRGEAAVRESGR